jgi:F0F1-type ATP synthase assembly protein I
VELRDRQDLNNGFGNALSRAVELAVTPMIFGFLGYLLDGKLGTRPLFMLVFFVGVLGYVFWKLFRAYDLQMVEEERKLHSPKAHPTEDHA